MRSDTEPDITFGTFPHVDVPAGPALLYVDQTGKVWHLDAMPDQSPHAATTPEPSPDRLPEREVRLLVALWGHVEARLGLFGRGLR